MPISEPRPGDVVVVPFPFTDRQTSKRRPALALSASDAFASGHTVLAMITSSDHAPWPLDTPIRELHSAGLSSPSVVRMKLFTLDNRLILRRAGTLARVDLEAVAAAVRQLLPRFLVD